MAVQVERQNVQMPRSRRGERACRASDWNPPRYFDGYAVLTAILLLACTQARAQRSSNWRAYKVADGLAETSCRSLTIGGQGRILVTHRSVPLITILDGYGTTNIPSPVPNAAPVYESPAGQLWSCSSEGLHEFREGQWVLHPVSGLALDSPTNADFPAAPDLSRAVLYPVRQGQVLMLLPDQLLQFNSEISDRRRVDVLRTSAQTRIGHFSGMTPSRDGGLWISGANGLGKFAGPIRSLSRESEWNDHPVPEELAVRSLRDPHEDSAGGVTLMAEDSTNKDQSVILSFDGQNWAAVREIPGKPIQAWRGPDGTLWAITGESLLQGSGDPIRLVENNEVPARSFYDVATEPTGAFWLATSDGLFRYAPLCWQAPAVSGGPNTPIRCITADKDAIWFVAGNELCSIRENRRQTHALPSGAGRALQNASRIFPVSNGTFVIETGDQLLQVDPLAGSFKELADAAKGERLKGLGFFQDGVLAIRRLINPSSSSPAGSTNLLGALRTFDGRTFRSLPIPDPPDSIGSTISRLFGAENGDVWVSAESGTAVFHERKWRAFPAGDKTAPASAVAFASGADGRVWCASPDQVWEFDGKDWSNARGGFDRINALLVAKDGSIWVASDTGLFRFFRGVWVENGVEDGLPAPSIRDICQDRNERIWASTFAGLSLYNPRADPDPPRTEVHPVGEKERNIPEGGALFVSFTAVDKWKFTPRFRLLYSRRVDSGDWSPFQDSTSITLTDLGPGKHELQVRAMDRNGNVDSKPASLDFAVVLPWYHERRLVLISSAGAAAVLFFAALAFNRHRRLVRSYARVEKEINERTRELEIANHELLQSQKMNALGTLAAGIAHDFNNILSIVKGSAQIIEENLDNPVKVRTRVDRIKTVVEQGSGIVKAMLGFSRDTDQQTGPCDLNATVEDTIRLLGDRFLREVEVRFEPARDLPDATCSKDFVQQILLNFIFNAADAMAKSTDTAVLQNDATTTASPVGRASSRAESGSAGVSPAQIIVGTYPLPNLSSDLVLPPSSAPAYVSVSVLDHGCGIPPENLSRIFEPFFTTKALSTKRGTGLGLSMAYELAKKMGAGLSVRSVINEGSTFTLILPVSARQTNSFSGPSPSPPKAGPERNEAGFELPGEPAGKSISARVEERRPV